MEHTEGKIKFGKTSEPILIISCEKSSQYICNVRIHQSGGGAIAEAMEENRKANAHRLVKCWNSHDKLINLLSRAAGFVSKCIDENNNAGTVYEEIQQAIAESEV
jgi:hypothetical protein